MLCYRAKHPTKVYVWAGFSKRGSTVWNLHFRWNNGQDAVQYMDISDQTLVPFIVSLS